MGYEHDIYNLKCGCIQHHTYRDACDMGPIPGTSQSWTIYCENHDPILKEQKRRQREDDALTRPLHEKIARLEAELEQRK